MLSVSAQEIALMLGAGAGAGLLGGLLGVGGGVVLIPVLRFGLGLPPAQAAATCIVAVFFTTVGGSVQHYRQGYLQIRTLVPMIISGMAATAVFSVIFGHLAVRGQCIDLAMAIVFSLVSGRMLLEGIRPPGEQCICDSVAGFAVDGTPHQKIGLGLLGGTLPGLLGIGTGGILVPAFAYWLRAPMKAAIAASLCCFSFNALVSASFKVAQGFVDPVVARPYPWGRLQGLSSGLA